MEVHVTDGQGKSSGGIGEEVRRRVQERVERDGVSQAEAIRQVAKQMGRGESATASAFYGAVRRQRSKKRDRSRRQERPSHRHSQLYSEMLPLVEAGASAEQAARRFGAEDDIEAIAEGFEEWRESELGDLAPDLPPSSPLERQLAAAEARIVTLEAANRILMRDLEHSRRTLRKIRASVDGALEPGQLE
jgi:hypothetical protein